jgi:glucokinase
MEAYAGRRPMEEKARAEHEDGRHTDLFKLMRKHGRDRLTSGIWERALDHGDKLAAELVDRAIGALGTGVASAINLIDPEVVVLGGGLGDRLWPRYLDEFRAELAKHLFVDDDPPELRPAKLGDLGGAIGASLLVSSSGP